LGNRFSAGFAAVEADGPRVRSHDLDAVPYGVLTSSVTRGIGRVNRSDTVREESVRAASLRKGSALYTLIRGQTGDGASLEHRLEGNWDLEALREWARVNGFSGGLEVSFHSGSIKDLNPRPAVARFSLGIGAVARQVL
jgi:hypothetical protein